MSFLEHTDFTTRKLQPGHGNKKGVLDLILFKKQARDYILDSYMPKLALHTILSREHSVADPQPVFNQLICAASVAIPF